MQHLSYTSILVGLFGMIYHVSIIQTGPLGPLPNQVPSNEPASQVSAVLQISAPVEDVPDVTPQAVLTPAAPASVAAVKAAIKEEYRPVSRYFKEKRRFNGPRSR